MTLSPTRHPAGARGEVRSDEAMRSRRLENLVTGSRSEFGSGRELLDCIASDLAADAGAQPADRTRGRAELARKGNP
jgi:hypothetical protein